MLTKARAYQKKMACRDVWKAIKPRFLQLCYGEQLTFASANLTVAKIFVMELLEPRPFDLLSLKGPLVIVLSASCPYFLEM